MIILIADLLFIPIGRTELDIEGLIFPCIVHKVDHMLLSEISEDTIGQAGYLSRDQAGKDMGIEAPYDSLPDGLVTVLTVSPRSLY